MSKKSNNKSGMSMKTKWIITGILCVLAVLTVVVVAADGCFDFKPGSVQSNDKAVAESAAPDADKDTAKTGGTHTVLVTAGNGGTTDPNIIATFVKKAVPTPTPAPATPTPDDGE